MLDPNNLGLAEMPDSKAMGLEVMSYSSSWGVDMSITLDVTLLLFFSNSNT